MHNEVKKDDLKKFTLSGCPTCFIVGGSIMFFRGIEFNLSKDFLYELYEKQKGNCYYTGKKMVLKIYSGIKPNRENIEKFKDYLTIDRLDSSKGYEKGNVALCTLKVNTAKGSLNYDEFLQIANFVKKRDFNIN